MNLVGRTLTIRLLRDYYNGIMQNYELFYEEDISLDELETQLMLLDEEYADKILGVLE